MEPARLPDDAPSVLLQDTVELDNLRLAWPQILSQRRRVPEALVNTLYHQILYGCQHLHCKTATCFTRRKHTSRKPLRSFTALSARALALELATQDDPEKHLCPHLCASRSYDGDQSEATALPEASVKITRSLGLQERSCGKSPGPGEPTGEKNGPGAKSAKSKAKSKDPKSFAQALFDTNALRGFHAAPHPPCHPRIVEGCFFLEDKAGLAPTAEDRSVKGRMDTEHLEELEAEPRSSTKTSTRHDGRRSDLLRHAEENAADRLHPQTLSHFSMKNVKALVWSAHVSHSPSLQEQNARDFFGWTVADRTGAVASTVTGSVGTSILPFARQSIIYVLSDLPALSSSFKHEVDRGGHSYGMPDSFGDIVKSFSWLRKFEGYPPIILPSLLQAADTFYASLLSIEDAERSRKRESGSGSQPSVDDDHSKTIHKVKPEVEASHFASIIFAALVATVPRCDEQVWLLVRDCHRSGVIAQDQVKDSMVIRSLQSVMDAFEDRTALELLAKLVKILTNSASVIRLTNKSTSEDGSPHATPRIWKHVVEWIVDRLLPVGVRPFAFSSEAAELRGKDLPSPDVHEMGSPPYIAMIVEWLTVLVLKRWDGKAVIDLSSVAGQALEVLRRCSERLGTTSRAASMLFQIPMMAAQLDFLDLPTEWPNPFQTNRKHLLQYPFILDLKGKVCCFRAMNYKKMFKAHEDSVVASRLRDQTSYRDALTGLGEIRLQEGLARVFKSYFVMEIRRQSVLLDALNQLWRREKRELMKPLKVRMGMDEGEEGVDYGGVQQEFFRIAVAEALNPDYGLFAVIDEQSRMTWLRPFSEVPIHKLEMVGLLFSLAMYNGLTLPVNFPLAFYRKLQGSMILCPEDIEDGWPTLARGLRSLLDWSDGDVAEVFSRTYEIVFERLGRTLTFDMLAEGPPFCGQCGQPRSQFHTTRASCRDGLASPPASLEEGASEDDYKAVKNTTAEECPSTIMVTNKNREQYVLDHIFWLTDKSIRLEFDAFARGFTTCISRQSLSLLSAQDFKQLVEGTQDVTVEDLRRIANYDGGYTPAHETIQSFWRTVEDFSPNQIGLLLEFVTASDRLPVTGVDNMSFSIQKNGEGDDRLPTSMTCYGRLLLPEYSSRAVLREKLCLAVENSKGFGVA